jgi:hypothetical protein
MTDYVVDTNVWVKAEEIEHAQASDEQCATQCLEWLRDFVTGQNRLVLDDRYMILGEYRKNIMRGGLAEQWLNQLETKPRDVRLVELPIKVDKDGYAEVPPPLAILDASDRKLVAVALAHKPIPPIVDATDTGWARARQALESVGITVHELCMTYIDEKLKRRSS